MGQLTTFSYNLGSSCPTKVVVVVSEDLTPPAHMTGGCYVDMFMLLKSCFGGRHNTSGQSRMTALLVSEKSLADSAKRLPVMSSPPSTGPYVAWCCGRPGLRF